ncbi:hypothetical protein [Methylobacterium sp. Leaf456]|uniref:hypothetical protein n=1 Tax=Methylobacterium sp. Leaf456 TaxID=1736382 RepID=UPI0012E3ACE2|nr:hypothetical protein [Methylobacterium sp. Leaf456]
MKTLFKVFMQKGPYVDVVRFYSANRDRRDPSLKGPIDLIEPTLEKLQLSARGRDPALWAELKTALPALTVGDFIVERGADWFVALLSEPASGSHSWNSIQSATRQLRKAIPFVVAPKPINLELLMQCGLETESGQAH